MSKIVSLFSYIPICRIKEDDKKTKYYLFGFIPFLTIKRTEYNGFNNVWTKKIYKYCPRVGKNLWCGCKTLLTSNCYLGDCCCFNGCEINGLGKVTIGSHFHSGVELLIIAQNHNYDFGNHIPYSPDDYIYKNIEIGDFVWIGSRVTILPGSKIGEGAIIQAGAVLFMVKFPRWRLLVVILQKYSNIEIKYILKNLKQKKALISLGGIYEVSKC